MKPLHNRRKLIAFGLAVAGIVLLAGALRSLLAGYFMPKNGDLLRITAEDYTLDTTLDGSLVAAGDLVQVGLDGVVNGDVGLIGDTVIVAGHVKGDLTVLATNFQLELNGVVDGNLSFLGEKASIMGHVVGDVTTVGDVFRITEFGKIDGQFRACQSIVEDATGLYADAIAQCSVRDSDAEVAAAFSDLWTNFVTTSGGLPAILLPFTLAFAFAVTGLSALAVTVFPASFSRIEEALLTKPGRAAGAGFAVLLLCVGVAAAVTVITAAVPALGLIVGLLVLIGFLALLVLAALGWAAMSLLVGHYVLRLRTGRPLPPLISAIVGSLGMFTLLHLLLLFPGGLLIVPLLTTIFVCMGLGAALATRAGRRTLTARYFVQG